MSLRGDERGQALQVGAVLLFGILIVFLSMYQVTVVPDQNAEVEFNSYLEASADMNRLHADVLASGSRGVQAETTVQTGTTYPARAIFLNPPPPTGSVRTSDAANATIAAVATDGELAEYWNGTSHNFSTKRIVFRPPYNEISVSPVVVTGSLTYRNTSGSAVPLGAQTIVRNNRITLVTIMGNLSESGISAPVVVEPVSAAAQTITVTDSGRDPDGDGEDELVLTIPSRLSTDTWNETLAGQPRFERAVSNGSRVDLHFAGNLTYELRLARVEVRGQSDSDEVPAPDPHYIVTAGGDGAAISEGQSVDLVAEVRDRFNNPKSGVNVTFELPDGTTVNRTTGAEGRATFRYAPSSNGTKEIVAYYGGNDTRLERTTFTVSVGSGGGDDSLGGSSDPASASGDASGIVVLNDVVPTNESGQTYWNVTFTINNTANQSVNVTGIRLNYVTAWNNDAEIIDGPDSITGLTLSGASRVGTATEAKSPWFFEDLRLPTGVSELDVRLNESYSLAQKNNAQKNNALTISITVYFEGGLAATYSVYLF